MAAVDGKSFEEKFRRDWIKSFPNGTIDRLYDNMSGYRAVSNVSDFICYNYPLHYYIECKAHKGVSIPFTSISQYDKLIKKSGIKGVRAGVVLFLYEKDKVLYIPATTIQQLKKDGKKSVGIKSIEEGYNIIEIPSKKLKIYMDSDYSCLSNLKDFE